MRISVFVGGVIKTKRSERRRVAELGGLHEVTSGRKSPIRVMTNGTFRRRG